MSRTSFNSDWTVRPPVGAYAAALGAGPPPQTVTLPRDAMIGLERSARNGSGSGYFPGGVFEYNKTFDVPEDCRNKRVTIQFECVYQGAMVFINGEFAAQRPFGYSNFYVPADAFLKYGEPNTIRVVARAHQDSSWYSGIGIHRDTWIIIKDLVHVVDRLARPSAAPRAVVSGRKAAAMNTAV